MIVSHRHRFIFVKTGKTAGTSVEIALSALCAPDDVITPISDEDEAIRLGLGHPGPQNHLVPVAAWTRADWARVLRRPTRPSKARPRFYNHMPAAEIAARLPREWSTYLKFCVTRNPWDRAVSTYFWRFPAEPRPTIAQFLRSDAAAILTRGTWGRYTIDKNVAVDRVCRFESLESDLASVLAGLGLNTPLHLPQTKAATRTDRRPYQEILDPASRDRVAELCADEIAFTGYTF